MITIEFIAEVCHTVNKAYSESLGDYSHNTWENAPQWQKDSAIKGVEFHIQCERTPEESHMSWMQQKIEDGWTYGEVKDANLKTHPCLKPYVELPMEQRVKDELFRSIVEVFKDNGLI